MLRSEFKASISLNLSLSLILSFQPVLSKVTCDRDFFGGAPFSLRSNVTPVQLPIPAPLKLEQYLKTNGFEITTS